MWPPIGQGGGIFCDHSDAKIIYNDIKHNFSFMGGGIYCDNSNALIMGNNIEGNMASFYGGGGIYCRYHSDVKILNNIISNNEVGLDGNGGGIYYGGGNPQILNNIITGNYAEGFGGGLVCFVSDALIMNNIFWGDSAGTAYEIYSYDSLTQFCYNNIQGGWEGEGNIDTDPLFRDPDNGDFHLMSTACGDPYDSPCIDTGSPAIIDSLLDCLWGLGTILSDMGAYGGGDSATVGIDDFTDRLPSRFALMQNYPNPFNSSTTTHYGLPEQSDIRIEIYNILGQRVATVYDGPKEAGYHTVTWKPDGVPSGVYFARLQAGDRIENTRMVLLK
jgi:parallel beta-helix repeat protein